jgi:hypothetical protein
VGFLFGLAMAIDPYVKSALRSLLFFPVLFGMRRQREHARMIRKLEKGEQTLTPSKKLPIRIVCSRSLC